MQARHQAFCCPSSWRFICGELRALHLKAGSRGKGPNARWKQRSGEKPRWSGRLADGMEELPVILLPVAKSPRAHEQEATDAKSYQLSSRGKSKVM